MFRKLVSWQTTQCDCYCQWFLTRTEAFIFYIIEKYSWTTSITLKVSWLQPKLENLTITSFSTNPFFLHFHSDIYSEILECWNYELLLKNVLSKPMSSNNHKLTTVSKRRPTSIAKQCSPSPRKTEWHLSGTFRTIRNGNRLFYWRAKNK